MKRLLTFILSFSFFSLIYIHGQQISPLRRIVFELISPSLSNDSSVFICGNIPQLGNWNPSAVKMKNSGDHKWSLTINSEASFPIEYKYTRGSWQKEGTQADGKPLSNFIIKVVSDTIIKDTVRFWLSSESRKHAGQITGNVKYHPDLKGINIPGRDIIVWLPPDYDPNKSRKYPVLYMHDGQNLFDPLTSAFGVDWEVDETADSLIRRKLIHPMIIVGIYNTKERMNEYVPGPAGNAYMEFVVHIVKPLIDRCYKTLPGRSNTFTGGSSAGGTISFLLAWNYSSVFSKAICMSPAFKIMNIDVVKGVKEYTGKKKKLLFYLDNGGKGLEERLQPGIDEMIEALEGKGFRRDKNLFWIKAQEAEHNEAAWAERMPEALKWINGVSK